MKSRFSFFAPNDDHPLKRLSGWCFASVVVILTLVMPAVQIWHAGQHEHGASVGDATDVHASHHQGLFASEVVTSSSDSDDSHCSLCQILAGRSDFTPGDYPPVVSTTIFLVAVVRPAFMGHQWSMPARAPPARGPPTIA
jgi:hypothetical protein